MAPNRFIVALVIILSATAAEAQAPAPVRSVAEQRRDLELWWEQARALQTALQGLGAAGGQAPAIIALSAQLAPGSTGSYGALGGTPEGEAIRKELASLKPGASTAEAKDAIARALRAAKTAESAFVEQSGQLPPDPSGRQPLSARGQGAPAADRPQTLAPPPPPGSIPAAWNPPPGQMAGLPPGAPPPGPGGKGHTLLGVAADADANAPVRPPVPLMPVSTDAAKSVDALKGRINLIFSGSRDTKRLDATAFAPGSKVVIWMPTGLISGAWRLNRRNYLRELLAELDAGSVKVLSDQAAFATTLRRIDGQLESDYFQPNEDSEKVAGDKVAAVYGEIWAQVEAADMAVRPVR
jgi:hypothetical protein